MIFVLYFNMFMGIMKLVRVVVVCSFRYLGIVSPNLQLVPLTVSYVIFYQLVLIKYIMLFTSFQIFQEPWSTSCRNPSLKLATKASAYKSVSQEGSPGVTFHAPGSAKECEGMNLQTPKNFQIFRRRLQRSKFIGLRRSLYHWKTLAT
jgi:hypothetical protein